jgi:hypothetical protein
MVVHPTTAQLLLPTPQQLKHPIHRQRSKLCLTRPLSSQPKDIQETEQRRIQNGRRVSHVPLSTVRGSGHEWQEVVFALPAWPGTAGMEIRSQLQRPSYRSRIWTAGRLRGGAGYCGHVDDVKSICAGGHFWLSELIHCRCFWLLLTRRIECVYWHDVYFCWFWGCGGVGPC